MSSGVADPAAPSLRWRRGYADASDVENLLQVSELDQPRFPTSVGADAAMTLHGTFRQYFAPIRKLALEAQEVRPWMRGTEPPKKGFGRLLSLRGVLTFAAAAPLIRLGLPVVKAYSFASVWTDDGDMVGEFEGYQLEPVSLYPAPAITCLVYGGPYAFHLAPAKPGPGGMLTFPGTSAGGSLLDHGQTAAPVLINLNAIHAHTMRVCSDFLRRQDR